MGLEATAGRDFDPTAAEKSRRKPALPYGVSVGAGRKAAGDAGGPSLKLLLKRVDVASAHISRFVGKAYRNCVTGRVHLKRVAAEVPDFTFTDLWARASLFGSTDEFVADRYLFRAVPLTYRTWIYHHTFRRQRKGLGGYREDLVREVLSHRCVDAPISAGRWSPLVLYAPAALVACLSGDIVAVLVSVFAVCALFTLAKMMNSPETYRYCRLASLPLRLGAMATLLLRSGAAQRPVERAGLWLWLLLAALDLLAGDGGSLAAYRFACRYEVFRELPERVFVCRRHGAAHLEDAFGERGAVDECVTGTGAWQRNYTLIADLQGLLVELRPMQPHEWQQAAMQYYESRAPLAYICLDVFADEHLGEPGGAGLGGRGTRPPLVA